MYFLGGYLFAPRLFALADRVRAHPRAALAGLAAWAGVNAALAFAPTGIPAYPSLASLPVIGLALGAAGASAIIATAALLTGAGGVIAAALRACGRRSIVIYLAFFLPMAVARTLLTHLTPDIDVGLASLVVTAVAVVAPLALERIIRGTASPSCSSARPPSTSRRGRRRGGRSGRREIAQRRARRR